MNCKLVSKRKCDCVTWRSAKKKSKATDGSAKKKTSKATATRAPGGKRAGIAQDGGGKALVIVESPAKSRTLNKFLGRRFSVLASNGHIMDLPKSELGVDIENSFEPKYVPIRGKTQALAKIKTAARSSFSQ